MESDSFSSNPGDPSSHTEVIGLPYKYLDDDMRNSLQDVWEQYSHTCPHPYCVLHKKTPLVNSMSRFIEHWSIYHMAEGHELRFPCMHCDKVYKYRRDFRSHLHKAHDIPRDDLAKVADDVHNRWEKMNIEFRDSEGLTHVSLQGAGDCLLASPTLSIINNMSHTDSERRPERKHVKIRCSEGAVTQEQRDRWSKICENYKRQISDVSVVLTDIAKCKEARTTLSPLNQLTTYPTESLQKSTESLQKSTESLQKSTETKSTKTKNSSVDSKKKDVKRRHSLTDSGESVMEIDDDEDSLNQSDIVDVENDEDNSIEIVKEDIVQVSSEKRKVRRRSIGSITLIPTKVACDTIGESSSNQSRALTPPNECSDCRDKDLKIEQLLAELLEARNAITQLEKGNAQMKEQNEALCAQLLSEKAVKLEEQKTLRLSKDKLKLLQEVLKDVVDAQGSMD